MKTVWKMNKTVTVSIRITEAEMKDWLGFVARCREAEVKRNRYAKTNLSRVIRRAMHLVKNEEPEKVLGWL